jgi:hypothetical protein
MYSSWVFCITYFIDTVKKGKKEKKGEKEEKEERRRYVGIYTIRTLLLEIDMNCIFPSMIVDIPCFSREILVRSVVCKQRRLT